MELITDLHVHSHFSRATSKQANIEGLYKWGKIKGINILGTGDFTHPGWFTELRQKLEPAEPGLFRLKPEIAKPIDDLLPKNIRSQTLRFILTVEISNIYSKNGKARKLHHLIVAPDFAAVSAFNTRLGKIGNIKSDGRPILGLDSKELLKITMEISPEIIFIPAHIWTPWFSLFGSRSGFNSIDEAFEELTPQIKTIETGLSSDPFMNWRVDQLTNITITSNSDAHSPQKLGREATILNCDLNYREIKAALDTNDQRVVGTIEFFPQEGKYHYDGHKNCHIRFSPKESQKHKLICPVCHKPLTLGVDYRVTELSNHPPDYKPEKHKKVEFIIPLIEIISELAGVKSPTEKVWAQYEKLYSEYGNEFQILRQITPGDTNLAYSLSKMRQGDIYIEAGFDGVFGEIKIFGSKSEKQSHSGQMSLI